MVNGDTMAVKQAASSKLKNGALISLLGAEAQAGVSTIEIYS